LKILRVLDLEKMDFSSDPIFEGTNVEVFGKRMSDIIVKSKCLLRCQENPGALPDYDISFVFVELSCIS
jgi:hypothetical protein